MFGHCESVLDRRIAFRPSVRNLRPAECFGRPRVEISLSLRRTLTVDRWDGDDIMLFMSNSPCKLGPAVLQGLRG